MQQVTVLKTPSIRVFPTDLPTIFDEMVTRIRHEPKASAIYLRHQQIEKVNPRFNDRAFCCWLYTTEDRTGQALFNHMLEGNYDLVLDRINLEFPISTEE